jgi:hypothetical protein
MSIEAMKQALEALQFGLHVGFDESSERQIQKGGKAFDQHNQAITALRQAIDQAKKQEPVCDKDPRGCWSVRCQLGKVCKNTSLQPQREWVGLTEEEIDTEAFKDDHAAYFALGAIWANKKLREKNG